MNDNITTGHVGYSPDWKSPLPEMPIAPVSPTIHDWLCGCTKSNIQWVDANHPHVAINGPCWFCMACLSEFVRKEAP